MATQKGRNWSSGDIVTAANLSSVERGVSAVSSLYEPTTWANGDTVTAAALNNIEQGIVNAGDFSTAEVTIVNNLDQQLFANYGSVVVFEANEIGEGAPAMAYGCVPPIEAKATMKVRAPLYKGTCVWSGPMFGEMYSYAISGDITENMGMYDITGDCTITVGSSSNGEVPLN